MRCPSCSFDQSQPSSRCSRCGGPLSVSRWPTATGIPAAPPAEIREFPPGADFAGRYTFIERIGEGGMGRVYKAIDRRLDQAVAIKLLQPSIAAHPDAIRRFKSEVLLARQISHPNVCRVHDLGESDGLLYLSMAWIEGETLRRFLDQSGALQPVTALSVLEQTAKALEAAHKSQVVHRDLKPENIMIDARGAICVMDFGLASGGGAPGEGPSATTGGALWIVGTPPYIAPEQRRGEAADPRSDLYALGLIAWEMLTGLWPASKPDAGEIRSRIPGPLAPLLQSLLEEDRGRRCPSASALLAAIGEARGRMQEDTSVPRPATWRRARVAVVAAGTIVAAAVTIGLLARHPAPPPSRDNPGSVITGFYERGVHYLREEGDTLRGLGDAIQMLHRAVDKDPQDARAWAVLGEASWMRFRRAHDTESRTEAEASVTRALGLAPDLPEAIHARGLGLLAGGDAATAKADFERAVARAPMFDAAWESLGNACRDLGEYAPGLRALETAVRLRPQSYLHQIALGRFFERFGEYDAAATAYRKAIEIKPDQPWGWNNLGAMYLFMARRPDEAIPAFERSLELEERGIARTNLGTAYYYQRDYDKALIQYRRATELEPDDPDNWGNLGDALQMLQRPGEARAAYRHAQGLAQTAAGARPRDAMAQSALAKYCAKAGMPDCALDACGRAAALQPDNSEIEFTNAVARAAAGRQGEALDWLERAVRHGLGRVQLESEPFFAPLRSQARYRALLNRAAE